MSPTSRKRKQKASHKVPTTPKMAANKTHASVASVLGGILAKIVSNAWRFVVGISVLATIFAAGVYFLPSVTVELGSLTDPSRLISVPITIKNDGVITLTDVGVRMGICSVSAITNVNKPVNLVGDCGSTGKLGSAFAYGGWQHHRLLPGEKYSISLVDLFRAVTVHDITSANISIAVTYQPWFAPIGHEDREFRIIGGSDTGAPNEWRFVPLDEK